MAVDPNRTLERFLKTLRREKGRFERKRPEGLVTKPLKSMVKPKPADSLLTTVGSGGCGFDPRHSPHRLLRSPFSSSFISPWQHVSLGDIRGADFAWDGLNTKLEGRALRRDDRSADSQEPVTMEVGAPGY